MFWNKKEKEYLVIATGSQNNPVIFTTEEMPLYRDEPIPLKTKGFVQTGILYCSIRELLEKYEQITFIFDDLLIGTFYKKDIKDAVTEDTQDVVTEDLNKSNLLEIKLKDTDSVPEVYYKGERLDGPVANGVGLVDMQYHYHTEEDGSRTPDGANDISIEYYDMSDDSEHLDRKIIGHKRDI